VVIRDLDLVGITSLPANADPILLVYPNAMLLTSLASQTLEQVSRRDREVPKIADPIHLVELPPGDGPQRLRTRSPGCRGIGPVEDVLCPAIPE
jgi:hypothetical protein